MTVFLDHANLLKKMNFPRICLPLIVLLNARHEFRDHLRPVPAAAAGHRQFPRCRVCWRCCRCWRSSALFALGLGHRRRRAQRVLPRRGPVLRASCCSSGSGSRRSSIRCRSCPRRIAAGRRGRQSADAAADRRSRRSRWGSGWPDWAALAVARAVGGAAAGFRAVPVPPGPARARWWTRCEAGGAGRRRARQGLPQVPQRGRVAARGVARACRWRRSRSISGCCAT